MVRDPTVFVLGAGASQPYGFPSGLGLLNRIIDNLQDRSSRFVQDLEFLDFRYDDIVGLRNALVTGAPPSLDIFLQHHGEKHPEWVRLGKACIARYLIALEQPDGQSKLSSDLIAGQWIPYLMHELTKQGLDVFHHNRVWFVTFNFDRSLEWYAYRYLIDTLGTDEAHAASLLDGRFVHIHGDLGAPSWLDTTGEDYRRDMSPEVTSEMVGRCAERIRIISDELEAEQATARARELCEAARRVCFLGFGFHHINMERIKLGKDKTREIVGTSLGLAPGHAGALTRQVQRLKLFDLDVLNFLKDQVFLHETIHIKRAASGGT